MPISSNEFEDPMQRHLFQATDEFMSTKNKGKNAGKMRKFSGQTIEQLDRYMMRKYPDYTKEIKKYDILTYFSEEDLDTLIELFMLNPDRCLEIMEKMLVRRIRQSKFIRTSDIQAKVPAIAYYLQHERPDAGQELTK